MTSAEIFRKAADLIRTGGLYQRGRQRGANCTWTAIMTASPVGRAYSLGMLASERVAGKGPVGEWPKRLYNWNDNIVQNPAEVISLFDGLAFDEDLKAAATAPVDTTIPVAEQIPQLVEA